jgi:glycosyltransferase involved in cell wall biosynthesis
VPALLAAAAVFVLPSVWEGQPLILQEALRAGVPVVATRVGGTPELTGEDAALLVPPGDPAQLAGAVRAVLTDPALAARMRQAALDRARALPSPDDAVASALAEYARAGTSRAARTRG